MDRYQTSNYLVGKEYTPIRCPLVSVLMPAYNHEHFVENAVRSVWQQSHPNIELLVCDDFSRDRTAEIVNQLIEDAPIQMRLIKNEANVGICQTLNILLEAARGEWIAMLASDDCYKDKFIERSLEVATSKGDRLVCTHCDCEIIDETGTPIKQKPKKLPPITERPFYSKAMRRGHIYAPTFFASRTLFDRIGHFDPQMRAEDLDLHLRAARIAQFIYIPQRLVQKRAVPGSLGSNAAAWNDDIFRALEKHTDMRSLCMQKILRFRLYRQVERSGFDIDVKEALRLINTYGQRYCAGKLNASVFFVKGLIRLGLYKIKQSTRAFPTRIKTIFQK